MSDSQPRASSVHAHGNSESPSRGSIWAGRAISVLVVLFMLFDGVTDIWSVPLVLEALARLHLSVADAVGSGIVLLTCTAVYMIPRTSPPAALRFRLRT